MRSPVIFVLFLLLSTSFSRICAQESMNRVDEKGRKQGFWRKTDTAGNKIYEGKFRDNIPYDTFRYFYPGANLKTLSVFSESGRKVRSESFFKNGQPMAKGIYLDEKKDSTWQFFSEYDGARLSEENYTNGLKDGTSKIYFPGGGISEIITWKNDKKEGLWETYFTDGKIKMKGSCVNGEKSGPFVFYYNSGKVMITGEYLEGHQHGTWTYYSVNGEEVVREKYDKGILLDKTPKDPPPPKD
jgi:antitoxin component YwqK of YwqJK toxin-antitoxin module